jgi:hypothetical protein
MGTQRLKSFLVYRTDSLLTILSLAPLAGFKIVVRPFVYHFASLYLKHHTPTTTAMLQHAATEKSEPPRARYFSASRGLLLLSAFRQFPERPQDGNIMWVSSQPTSDWWEINVIE